MSSLKHLSNFVTMESFIHKAPLGASVPLLHFGKCCFKPTSNKKVKTNYKLHKSGDFCLFHSLLYSQHTTDDQSILAE